MAAKHQWTPPALVVGLQGSRKSCFLVQRVILPALSAGRKVVTNIPLHLERIKAAGFPVEDVELLTDMELLSSVPHSVGADIKDHRWHGAVIVLDEAGTLLPAGSGDLTMAHRWARLMAACRHAEISVWLAAQNSEQLAFPLRGVVAMIYHLRNLDSMFGLPWLSRSKLKVVGGWKKDKELTHHKFYAPPLRRSNFKPDKRVYSYYDSVDYSSGVAGGDERRFRPSRLAAGLVFLSTLPLIFIYLVGDIVAPAGRNLTGVPDLPFAGVEVSDDEQAMVYVCAGVDSRCGFYVFPRESE